MTTRDRIGERIRDAVFGAMAPEDSYALLPAEYLAAADAVLDELRKDLDVASDIAQLRDWWEGVQE